MKPKEPLKITTNGSSKKVYFSDDGKITKKVNSTPQIVETIENKVEPEIKHEKKKIKKDYRKNGDDIGTKWYQVYDEHNSNEVIDVKDSEMRSFEEHCKKCFNEELDNFQKNNPNDAKWLETALQKGTAKDRANAGALLVQANPLANLSALDNVVSLTKFSNKSSIDVLETITELFTKSLLPPHRKLFTLQQRGNDWKNLKSHTLDASEKCRIYAYWHYENELKDRFNTYLLNLQAALQNGKEINKTKAIISTSNLLKSCPEREAFLLTILVNKFGDPDKKIASKATYHLRQILLVHPNMAQHMIVETEKLIFRNNVNELAQHYGIGFLSLIAPIANVQSSQKLINICFCFFKIKIEKGDINSKTMQSILNCLRIAIQNINDFNTEKKKIEITTPDVVNTIYRLIYLSNISIAFQALSLLLQLVLVQNEKHDRFYNALYKKMTDMEIINANNKITSLYFHIIHRSVYQDTNVSRAKAFIKRLLQMTLSLPSAKACGALIVISKLLKSRPEFISLDFQTVTIVSNKPTLADQNKLKMLNFEESDDEEKYGDVTLDAEGKEVVVEKEGASEKAVSSWIHVKHTEQQKNSNKVDAEDKKPTSYDPFKRSAAYSGSEFTLYYELILLSKYFHPTVQVFVESIIKRQNIKYYGDPLKDFSMAQFLERFSFKNPKKASADEENSAFKHQTYKAKGSRGQSVHLLTSQTCTEDERFIFDFLQRKREIKETKMKFSDENEKEDDDIESIDDDEFDRYLDSVGAANDYEKHEKDFDYLSDMQKESTATIAESKNKKKTASKGDEGSDDDDEWAELQDSDENNSEDEFEGDESGTDQSIEEDDAMDSDMPSDLDQDEGESEIDDEEISPKIKKKGKKSSAKAGGDNLFAAVEDFSELIEKNSSSKHGTLGEIFNKDKSSQKQLDWEQKRHNDTRSFKRKNSFNKKSFGPKKKTKRF